MKAATCSQQKIKRELNARWASSSLEVSEDDRRFHSTTIFQHSICTIYGNWKNGRRELPLRGLTQVYIYEICFIHLCGCWWFELLWMNTAISWFSPCVSITATKGGMMNSLTSCILRQCSLLFASFPSAQLLTHTALFQAPLTSVPASQPTMHSSHTVFPFKHCFPYLITTII